jgi:hypothetical protein
MDIVEWLSFLALLVILGLIYHFAKGGGNDNSGDSNSPDE